MTWLASAVQQQRRKPSPSPPFLSTFPRQNLTAIKISFKSHGSAVFLLNKTDQHLIGYSSGSQSPKGNRAQLMFDQRPIWLKAALGEL
ncbi:hypothetical protein [Aeromonas hydrophila]|uniref:hypothetical protein n=1 Tax=Aeromonas hydrophila TaxID=644 RepID=UPI002B486AE7|nr:hypothetical protein [Aeromonas hydrophila]